jgi:hypothetical protein
MSRVRKPTKPSARKRRYSHWVERVVEYLKETGEERTVRWLLENLPYDRYSPTSATSGAQKLTREPRIGSVMGVSSDLHGYDYPIKLYFYIGDCDEE